MLVHTSLAYSPRGLFFQHFVAQDSLKFSVFVSACGQRGLLLPRDGQLQRHFSHAAWSSKLDTDNTFIQPNRIRIKFCPTAYPTVYPTINNPRPAPNTPEKVHVSAQIPHRISVGGVEYSVSESVTAQCRYRLRGGRELKCGRKFERLRVMK